jgi:hypothetical protein
MPGMKREAPDGVALSAGPSATRVKTEQDDNDDTGNGNKNEEKPRIKNLLPYSSTGAARYLGSRKQNTPRRGQDA